MPKIESNFKNLKPGDYIELTCQVKYLPSRFDLYWTFNDKKITNANIINKMNHNNHHHHYNHDNNNKKNNQNNKTFKSSIIKQQQQQQLRDRRNNNNNNNNQSGLVIINDKINNQTISKLRILNFDEQNKGIYRCKYEKLEAKYIVDFKSKGIMKI